MDNQAQEPHDLDTLLTPDHQWLVDLRRHFHRYPEPGFQEWKTAAKIAEVLDGLGVPFLQGVAHTGVVACLAAETPGPTLAMRADMDALPLTEANDVPYRSECPGMMHACGHDGHVTVALGVVRRLLESRWRREGRGKILFFFQPAEEGGGGAKAMIDSGVMDAERIEAFFACHMHPELPAGHIGLIPGVSNAASNTVHIRIRGKGGHGAQPHLCRDPLVAGAFLVTHLQSIVSRSVSPMDSAVLTIGCFEAGTAPNIIPEEAVLQGTMRTLRPEVRDLLEGRLKALVDALARGHDVETELKVLPGYPLLVNDSNLVEYCRGKAVQLLGEHRVHREGPRMGAEDFAYFAMKAPGLMIRIGCRDPEKEFAHGLHSPHFDLDERALDVAVRLMVELLTGYGGK